MPYSHKIKTKLIWADKESPKHKRYNKIPYSTEPSKCKLLGGHEIEIPADIPLRRGKDIVSIDDLRHSFPVFLMMVESIRDEVEGARDARRVQAKEEADRIEREKRESEERAKLLSLKPGFVEGLPITLPITMVQRGFNFVRQFSQSEPERKEPESENLVREMVESLLDDYDEDDLLSESDSAYDMDFGPIGTPKHCRKVKKRLISASEENDEIAPLIVNDEISPLIENDEISPLIENVENKDEDVAVSDLSTKTKKPTRRKRNKKKK